MTILRCRFNGIVAGPALLLLFSLPKPVCAGLTSVSIFDNTVYFQTSGSAPITPTDYFNALGGGFANPGDFSSVSVSYPGPGSPKSLPIFAGNAFGVSSTLYLSLAALHADYPFGTYTYTGTGGGIPNTGVINSTADYFTAGIPALTASTYNGLQGLNPGAPFNIAFNSFTPNASVSQGFSIFSIFDTSTGLSVFTFGSQSPSFTGGTLPANTLMPNHQYEFDLIFSDVLLGFDSTHGVGTQQNSDVRTDGFFTTGTPEPGTLGLIALGAVGIAVLRRRSRAGA